jgi:TolB-like protein
MIPTGSGRTGVPMQLERIVNKAIAKKINLRYQNVEDLLIDLRALQLRPQSNAVSASSRRAVAQPLIKTKVPERKRPWFYGSIASLVILLVAAALFFWPTRQAKERFTSIAVLPFADMSPNKDQEYFCDGMTEEILTKLSKLGELKVIARTSVMRYKNSDKSIKQIGEELGVATILEGSIRREEDNILVTAQLINVEDESHLWTEKYQKKLASVFDLQEDVSQAIAEALRITLTPTQIAALASTPPKNTEAYEYYLKGKHHLRKYSLSFQEDDFQTVLDMFNTALKSDSNYALAYVGLATAYFSKYVFSGLSDQKAFELNLMNAEIAVKLDPNSAETQAMLAGTFAITPKPDYDQIHKCLKTALRLNPNLADANFAAAVFMWRLGLAHQAIKYFYRTIELDPLGLGSYHTSAELLMQLDRFEEAAAQLQKQAEIEPGFEAVYRVGAKLAILTKKYDQADSLIAKAERINPKRIAGYKALVLAAANEKEKALALSQEPEIYALLGMKDDAIEFLKNRAASKESLYLFLLNYSVFANLRDDPRFIELVESEKKKYEEVLRRYGDLGVE